jgi:hypothetical protein
MLIKLIKNNSIVGYAALIILCFIFFLFKNNFSLTLESAVVAGIILLCSIFLIIVIRNQALSKNSVISGLLFTVLGFSDPFFGDVWLAAKMFVAIVAFFYLLRSFDKTNGYVPIFNGAFLFSCISVFDPVFVFALPFIWIILIIYSDNNYRNWIISLIAILLPYLIYFCFCFLVYDLSAVNAAFDNLINVPVIALFDWDKTCALPAAEFLIAIVAFVAQIKSLRGDIVYRKKVSLFLATFVYFSLFEILFYAQGIAHIVLPVIAAFLIGKYFHNIKKTWIAEILLWGMIVGTIVCL